MSGEYRSRHSSFCHDTSLDVPNFPIQTLRTLRFADPFSFSYFSSVGLAQKVRLGFLKGTKGLLVQKEQKGQPILIPLQRVALAR